MKITPAINFNPANTKRELSQSSLTAPVKHDSVSFSANGNHLEEQKERIATAVRATNLEDGQGINYNPRLMSDGYMNQLTIEKKGKVYFVDATRQIELNGSTKLIWAKMEIPEKKGEIKFTTSENIEAGRPFKPFDLNKPQNSSYLEKLADLIDEGIQNGKKVSDVNLIGLSTAIHSTNKQAAKAAKTEANRLKQEILKTIKGLNLEVEKQIVYLKSGSDDYVRICHSKEDGHSVLVSSFFGTSNNSDPVDIYIALYLSKKGKIKYFHACQGKYENTVNFENPENVAKLRKAVELIKTAIAKGEKTEIEY